ncbi:MAG: hypothetical protein K0B06_05005 [Brevefilum sp.]|nr:hypothetical protein [Brevefilum sp.]
MRKLYWIVPLIFIPLAALLFVQVSGSKAASDGFEMVAPTACPSSGCAAGQRLNYRIEFSVTSEDINQNTQVCVYTPADGDNREEEIPWASDEHMWISKIGLISGKTYQQGQVDDICTDHLDDGDQWLLGSHTQLTSGTSDQLEFAFNIHPDAQVDGYVKVKVFQIPTPAGDWGLTASFSNLVSVAKRSETVYVAQTETGCGTNTPCYVNSGDDLEDGLGTGLRDAIMAVNQDDEILILKDYAIKDHTVLVDKQINLRGYENALITYIGNVCDSPMLLLTEGGTLSELTINDGNCTNPSRNLIDINSENEVSIQRNTLVFGEHAIYIYEDSGNVTVTFNHIINNDNYAVYRASGTQDGEVKIFANNIIDNRIGYQVNCNELGTANHNFWGETSSGAANALNCTISNGKQLGAAIQLATERPGVQGQSLTVTTQMSYAFNEKIGARRSAGGDYDIIIVNHGAGLVSNVPFYENGAGNINTCSNYYDVFLTDDAIATNLILALNYDLSSDCVNEIESSTYCGSADSKNYPLWWYDPATNATDGWDRTGDNPQGPGAGGATGQETTCHLDTKEIRVLIDNTGRPRISTDLGFTPFVIGLPFINGITLSEFTAQLDGINAILQWVTTSETNVKGFYVLRSDTVDGIYNRISSQIEAIGDIHIGGIYQFTDDTIAFSNTYYYKIEVIDIAGNSIATHGPVSILSATATPTATQTHTPTPVYTPTRTATSFFYESPTPVYTPTRTATTFFYRSPTPVYTPTRTATTFFYRSPTPIRYNSPTPYYRPRTATPIWTPTQVRTYGPSPTGTQTFVAYPPQESTPDPGYPLPGETGEPIEWEQTPTLDPYPITETPAPGTPTPTQDIEDIDDTPAPGMDDEGELPVQQIRWIFIMVGIAGGLSLIGAVSAIVAETRFS